MEGGVGCVRKPIKVLGWLYEHLQENTIVFIKFMYQNLKVMLIFLRNKASSFVLQMVHKIIGRVRVGAAGQSNTR